MPPSDKGPEAVADQSLAVVTSVLALVPDAVVIGGWGTWKRLGLQKSHDIDLVVDPAGRSVIQALCSDWGQSTHLGGRQWRGTLEGVHVDVYLPHQSRLGRRLQLRVEGLLPHTEVLDSWRLLTRPAQAVSKLAGLLDRPDSLPGEKDRHELRSLLQRDVSPADVAPILQSAAGCPPAALETLIAEAFDYLQDLRLDRTERARLRAWPRSLRRAMAAPAATPPRQP